MIHAMLITFGVLLAIVLFPLLFGIGAGLLRLSLKAIGAAARGATVMLLEAAKILLSLLGSVAVFYVFLGIFLLIISPFILIGKVNIS